tara:strand:+ start:164 stop:367 length:204 start_codon:yes stop_codon:yes gene_type:complete
MRYKDKCLDHIESIERVNKRVLDIVQQVIVTNNTAMLQECVQLLTSSDGRYIEYLKNMIELEENPPF